MKIKGLRAHHKLIFSGSKGPSPNNSLSLRVWKKLIQDQATAVQARSLKNRQDQAQGVIKTGFT